MTNTTGCGNHLILENLGKYLVNGRTLGPFSVPVGARSSSATFCEDVCGSFRACVNWGAFNGGKTISQEGSKQIEPNRCKRNEKGGPLTLGVSEGQPSCY
jgi:hypothetical protein